MKLKTQDLTGVALDWAVTQCAPDDAKASGIYTYNPSTNWAQGGPIIERERIRIEPFGGDWLACIWNDGNGEYHMFYRASTPLIAAMRCYVESRLGDEIDLPDELLAV